MKNARNGHIIYADGDANIPESITDGHGQVALDLCVKCGMGEAELDTPCPARGRITDDDLVAVPRWHLAALGYAVRKAGLEDSKTYATLKIYQMAPPVTVMQPVILRGGTLKPDGMFWYNEHTVSELIRDAGGSVKE